MNPAEALEHSLDVRQIALATLDENTLQPFQPYSKLRDLLPGASEEELLAQFDAHDADRDGKLAGSELGALCAALAGAQSIVDANSSGRWVGGTPAPSRVEAPK